MSVIGIEAAGDVVLAALAKKYHVDFVLPKGKRPTFGRLPCLAKISGETFSAEEIRQRVQESELTPVATWKEIACFLGYNAIICLQDEATRFRYSDPSLRYSRILRCPYYSPDHSMD